MALGELATGAGLRIAAFVLPLLYDVLPEIADEALRGWLAKLPWIERCIFAELFNGDIAMHNFYLVAGAPG